MRTTEKMSIQDKKRKFRKLKSLLNTAWKTSNELVGEEPVFSKAHRSLDRTRDYIEDAKNQLNYIEYS